MSSLKVAVVNDLGDCTAVLAARGRPGAEQIRAGLAPARVAGSEVSTDMHSSCDAPLAEAGAASHNRYGAADAGEDELGMVNALHERLRGFLWRFRGVSTRRLQRYLWWFCWEEHARRSDASREAMLRSHVANGSYVSTRRDLEEEPPAVLGLLGVTGRVRRIQLGLIAIRVKSNSLETEQREVYAITWNRVPVITGWQSGLAILDHFPSLHSFLEEAGMEVETEWQVP